MSITYTKFIENIVTIQTARYGNEIRTAIYENFDYLSNLRPSSKDLTNSEYEALSEEEKMNGTTYYISDTGRIMRKGIPYGGGSSSSPSNVEANNDASTTNPTFGQFTVEE